MIVLRYLGVDATGIATSNFRKFGITTFVDHQGSTHMGGARVWDHHVMDADYLSHSRQATPQVPRGFTMVHALHGLQLHNNRMSSRVSCNYPCRKRSLSPWVSGANRRGFGFWTQFQGSDPPTYNL